MFFGTVAKKSIRELDRHESFYFFLLISDLGSSLNYRSVKNKHIYPWK